jgi:hypothetical protein
MKATDTIDAARTDLLLGELRLVLTRTISLVLVASSCNSMRSGHN